jgi:hypothetical protein
MNKFLNLKRRINRLIISGKFEAALREYSKFLKTYNKLSFNKKVEYKQEYDHIKYQLLLFWKIKDIQMIIKTDKKELIKKNIKQLKLYLSRPDISENLLDYAEKKYKYFIKFCEYKVKKENLEKSLKNVYNLTEKKNYGKALKEFPIIMQKFNLLNENFQNKELYLQLIRLKNHLETKLLEKKAYGKR